MVDFFSNITVVDTITGYTEAKMKDVGLILGLVTAIVALNVHRYPVILYFSSMRYLLIS